jgi:hypothetical protein
MVWAMTAVRPERSPPLSSPLRIVAGFAAVIALMITAVPVAAASYAPIGGPQYEPAPWTNGVVLCDFNSTSPDVTASARGDSSWGMEIRMGDLTQLGLAGLVAESASMSAATWVAENVSTAGSLSLLYTTNVPVYGLLGLHAGTANVTVTFSLSKFTGIPTNGSYRVGISLTVKHWPWLLLGGDLLANFSVAPATIGTDRLVEGGADGAVVTSASAASGDPLAFLSAPTDANATNGTSGVTSPVPVVGELLGLTPQLGTLSINFSSPASGASAVGYDPALVVVPPPTLPTHGPLGIPTGDYLAAGGAAVVICLAIAGGARRARRSPSDLEYVEEEA